MRPGSSSHDAPLCSRQPQQGCSPAAYRTRWQYGLRQHHHISIYPFFQIIRTPPISRSSVSHSLSPLAVRQPFLNSRPTHHVRTIHTARGPSLFSQAQGQTIRPYNTLRDSRRRRYDEAEPTDFSICASCMGKLDAMQSPAQSATQDSAAEIVDVVGSNVLVMLISVVTTLVTSECLEYYK